MRFINEWVVSELLSQEAQRRGMARSAAKQLEATASVFAVELCWRKKWYGGGADDVHDEEVAGSFKKNVSAFTSREDVARVSYALFSERDEANQFRASILADHHGGRRCRGASGTLCTGVSCGRVARNQYFTQATLFPDELWKLARSLPKEEVSYAVRTAAGYYVLTVHGIKHVGETPEFEFVKDEVGERLLIERRRARTSSSSRICGPGTKLRSTRRRGHSRRYRGLGAVPPRESPQVNRRTEVMKPILLCAPLCFGLRTDTDA